MVLKIYFQYDTLLSEKFQCFYNAYKIKLIFLCSSFYIFIHSLFSTCFSKLVFSYFPAHNFYSDFLEVAEWYLLLFHLLYCFFLKYLSSLIQLWESYSISKVELNSTFFTRFSYSFLWGIISLIWISIILCFTHLVLTDIAVAVLVYSISTQPDSKLWTKDIVSYITLYIKQKFGSNRYM